jgi:cobalt/nickel transport system permease protein
MHIPDGFLSWPVALVFWAISAALIILAIRRSRAELGERQVPLMGVMAAFVFAAQMINFPIAGGTSGHLLGGALVAILLGPWAGMLVMTSVIGVQALLFQDGGLVVMGANIFNMGLLTVLMGYGLYRGMARRSARTRLLTAGVAAWLSVIAGALSTSLQLWLSGTAMLSVVVPAMLGVHALIGLGEALITVGALAFIFRTRPDLVAAQRSPESGGKGWIAAGLLVALVVVLLSPFASANPDGLMRVATDLGFLQQGEKAPLRLLPGYILPAIGVSAISKVLAGAIGLAVVAVLAILIARFLRPNDAGKHTGGQASAQDHQP